MNRISKIIITILSLIIVGLLAYIVCDKFFYSNKNVNPVEEKEEDEDDGFRNQEKKMTWGDYLISNDVDIELIKYIYSDEGMEFTETKTLLLSSDQREDFFNRINECKVRANIATGLGGPPTYDVNFKYFTNNQVNDLYMYYGCMFILHDIEDKELVKYLDNDYGKYKEIIDVDMYEDAEELIKESGYLYEFEPECTKKIIDSYFK